MNLIKQIKKKVCNKKGYTIPTALAFMFLLLALAGSILLVSSYRFQKAYIRQQENQLYLYATSLVESHSNSIEVGKFNETISSMVEKTRAQDIINLSEYAKSYKCQMNIAQPMAGAVIKNEFTNQEIDLKLFITYKPQAMGIALPSQQKDYIQIGDQIQIEYRIKSKDLEYRITAYYYCSKDSNIGEDGSIVGDTANVNMKWNVEKYVGNFYSIRPED